MPRLIRRRPLLERIKSMLNPMDFLLWLSEEIETHDWSSEAVGTQLGLVMNFVFLIARANSGGTSVADPVFDDGETTGWLSYLMGAVVWFLIGFSGINAYYTLSRTRKYRLFEADVERKPETPSARRVRVQSSPVSSSPLRILADVMSPETAESRAHPDSSRDVWEIAIWDPLPVCLRLFCLFSPGHILVYMMFLPLGTLDARPSVTVFNSIVLQAIISGQLLLFQSRYSQQNKDTSIVQKEVMHEYNTKTVHPLMYPTVRDAGTQFSRDIYGNDNESVEFGTPTVQLRRGFKIHPNPNYSKHVDPDNTDVSFAATPASSTGFFTPVAFRQPGQMVSDLRGRLFSAAKPARTSTPGPSPLRPNPVTTVSTGTSTGTSTSTGTNTGGGYLGVMNHPHSPLKKPPTLGDLEFRSPRNNEEMARLEQFQSFQGDPMASPMKSPRKSIAATVSALNPAAAPQPTTNWARRQTNFERYPSMYH